MQALPGIVVFQECLHLLDLGIRLLEGLAHTLFGHEAQDAHRAKVPVELAPFVADGAILAHGRQHVGWLDGAGGARRPGGDRDPVEGDVVRQQVTVDAVEDQPRRAVDLDDRRRLAADIATVLAILDQQVLLEREIGRASCRERE